VILEKEPFYQIEETGTEIEETEKAKVKLIITMAVI
jgi:hypothetical protein